MQHLEIQKKNHLQYFVTNNQFFVVNGAPVPKTKIILYSGLLVFNIDRKTLDFKFMHSSFYKVSSFNQLPIAMAGFEQIIDTEVVLSKSNPRQLLINKDEYNLQSVIVNELANKTSRTVVGSSVYVIDNVNENKVYKYSPLSNLIIKGSGHPSYSTFIKYFYTFIYLILCVTFYKKQVVH